MMNLGGGDGAVRRGVEAGEGQGHIERPETEERREGADKLERREEAFPLTCGEEKKSRNIDDGASVEEAATLWRLGDRGQL